MTIESLFRALNWLDGTPLMGHIEPYRQRLFEQFFGERDEQGHLRYNLGLFGRAKKNAKTLDAMLAAIYALLTDSPGGNQVYIVANDEGQAADDLALIKKLVKANPMLQSLVDVKKTIIERQDGNGFIEVLPGQDAIGSHGKTFRLLVIDEIHGYRTWDLLEALTMDPTRPDTQTWITSYASLFHKPGAPLYDLMVQGKAGADPRMLFSWYAADSCTDPDFANLLPEQRANPSLASFSRGYLAQQQRRLPAHKYRRLHLNLPGLPEGSAFTAEMIMDAVARGIRSRKPESGVVYHGYVDMSGGSSDDAVLAIAHRDADDRLVLDRIVNQGPQPPFDPGLAVTRFAAVLKEFGLSSVDGDAYAGQTFRAAFLTAGITYRVSQWKSASESYEAVEPLLNAHRIVVLDVPTLESQWLGLVWRGGKITHPGGEHDDWVCAAVGSLLASTATQTVDLANFDATRGMVMRSGSSLGHAAAGTVDDALAFLSPASPFGFTKPSGNTF